MTPLETQLRAACEELGIYPEWPLNDDEDIIKQRPPYVSPTTHNGIFTVKSLKTGDHRTFKIHTQPTDANFAPGRRVVYHLRGPDNTQDYGGFAFVNEDGSIWVWYKKRTPTFEKYARMLERLEEHEKAGRIEVMVSTRCRVCNRTLTTPDSIKSGIGPICEGRAGQ